jgi:hypothetical protein
VVCVLKCVISLLRAPPGSARARATPDHAARAPPAPAPAPRRRAPGSPQDIEFWVCADLLPRAEPVLAHALPQRLRGGGGGGAGGARASAGRPARRGAARRGWRAPGRGPALAPARRARRAAGTPTPGPSGLAVSGPPAVRARACRARARPRSRARLLLVRLPYSVLAPRGHVRPGGGPRARPGATAPAPARAPAQPPSGLWGMGGRPASPRRPAPRRAGEAAVLPDGSNKGHRAPAQRGA